MGLAAQLLAERLEEARATYKLNLGYCDIGELPADFVATVKKHCPHVVELDLTSNGLASLPVDLADLGQLRVLKVKYNALTDVPDVVFDLAQLQTLDVAGNQIALVSENVEKLQRLQHLDLSGNRLCLLTDKISRLPQLARLHLENNQLGSLPDSIGKCPALVKLNCSTNLLRALPASLAALRKIQRLDFANNMVRKVPAALGHLRALKELNLRYNSLAPAYQAASDEGLSRFLAFLKQEEEREEAEARERMRPIGTQVGAFMEYRCKAQIAQLVRTAAGKTEVDNRPWSRYGHTLCKLADMFYLFGGTVVQGGKKSNSLYWLSMNTMEWHLQACGDVRPTPRSGHCAVVDPDAQRMIVFGGRSQERRRLNDTWELDLKTFLWRKQTCEKTSPAPRDNASAVFCQGHMVVFGGHTNGKRLNDLAVLDLSTYTWTTWASVVGQPSPRESAALCVGHGNLLFLHGGCSNFGMDDLWVYDQKAQAWTEVATGGRRPPIRRGHQLFVHDSALYAFGGYDELGAPACTLFRLPVAYGTNFAVGHLDWEELHSDRVFNRNRMAVMDLSAVPSDGRSQHAGHLLCFQLGSRMLGAVNDEDAEKGHAHFDVFAMADLAALAVKEAEAVQEKPKNGKRSRVEHTTNQLAKTPKSFTANCAAETRALAYLADFEAAFTALYCHRRPLYLCPANECGVPKFVCTTLRPTKLPYPELYSLEGATSFVVNAIKYEAFENELHLPDFLLSPQSTLAFQAGDSLDMATLLVSILAGAGFDAYVVVGYAPPEVVRNDQSAAVCPLLEAEAAAVEATAAAERDAPAAASTGANAAASKYTIKQGPVLESEVVRATAEAEAAAAAAAAEAEGLAEAAAAVAEREAQLAEAHRCDSRDRRLVHAWVLVKAGARDVAADTFVEVTSGRKYAPAACPYYGIEFAWNHENYWVCMGMPEPHSDSRLHPAKAHFDWEDRSMWEAVLKKPLEPVPVAARAGSAPGSAAAGECAPEGAAEGAAEPGEAAAVATPPLGATQRPVRPDADAGGGRPAATPSGDEQPSTTGRPAGVRVEMPFSWVPRLTVARDMLDTRVPKGSKKVHYRFSEHELFALFGETSKFDGCVERLSIFRDEAHQDREWYARRKDKLVAKRRYYDGTMLASAVEFYAPGSAYGIKELRQQYAVNAAGENVLVRRVGHYYCAARLEGLAFKDEQVDRKTVETYEGRADRLTSRSVTYAAVDADYRQQADKPLPITKMTEKFSSDPEAAAVDNVAKRTFYVGQDTIRVDYHVPRDRLTHSYRIYCKDGHSHVVEMDALAKPLDHIAQLEQFKALLQAEKDCTMNVRQSEWEAREFSKVRKQLNEGISLVTPCYDVMRVNANESDDDEEEAEEPHLDYLSPFLPKTPGTRGLSREEALRVREECLRALRDRLIERANIIQTRHSEETAALAKRQANFARDRDTLSKEAEAEYEAACERSAFKVQILEKRLKRHEEQAMRKYYDLDHKLRRDPRLAVLLEAPQ